MRKILVVIIALRVAFAVCLYLTDWGTSGNTSRLLITFVQEDAYEPLVDADSAASDVLSYIGHKMNDVLAMLYAALAIVATMWRLWSKEHEPLALLGAFCRAFTGGDIDFLSRLCYNRGINCLVKVVYKLD